MNNTKLSKEEKTILDALKEGKLKSTKNTSKEKARFRQYARNTLSKPRNINIRVSDRDLQKIKALAAEKGLPYQTFISSLLHQFSSKNMMSDRVDSTQKVK
jgi:predicted DNA binding CopG/RHH family protein